MVKKDLPSYHGIVGGFEFLIDSLAHSLNILPCKFEFNNYQSFGENKFEKDQRVKR